MFGGERLEELELLEVQTFENGVTLLRYAPKA
jgi:hypothetical protein